MLNIDNIQSLIDNGEGYNVEFKVRIPSKIRELTEEICAFANADGGYLLIGVDDNGQVVDTNLENDKRSAIQGSIREISPALPCELYSVNVGNKTVWVIDVPSGKDKPYIFSGSIYVREGANSQKLRTAEEMRSFFQECNKIFFDHIPCHWFNIYTDADEQMIKDFRTEAKLSPSTPNKYLRTWNCLPRMEWQRTVQRCSLENNLNESLCTLLQDVFFSREQTKFIL